MPPDPPADQPSRNAITRDLDANLFVEAGAGSGKTTALVDRVLALVDRGDELRRLAAITFTEKAAGELRDRLRMALDERCAHTDPVIAGRAERALHQLDGAAIGTLHAFAQRLLREHPVEAGLPPRLEVLDEVESGLLFDDDWRVLQERLLADPRLERPLLLLLGGGVKIGGLLDLARALRDDWDRVDAWLRTSPALPEVLTLDRTAVDDLLRVCARRHGVVGDDKLAARLAELDRVAHELLDGDDDLVLALVDTLPRSCTLGLKPNWRRAGHDVAVVRSELVEACGAIRAARDRLLADALLVVLHALGTATVDAAAERRRNGRLEFHDLLVLARQLVTDPRHGLAVRRVLHEHYRHLLLDEFQDTDPIQLELAVRITAPPELDDPDWTRLHPEPGRLFVVGDPKQSIYRFRRADIGVYLDARDRLGATVLTLTANFRTVEPVITWVNHVFGHLITARPGAQPGYEPLDAQRDAPPAGPAVVVLGADAHGDDALAGEQHAREASDVAAVVARALAEEWPVHDQVTKQWRPARPGDITILLPARTSLPALEAALDAAGIAYRADSSSLVYASTEIRALLLTLRAVADPTDELALLTALRSPLYGCSDVELARWVVERRGRLSLRTSSPPDPLPEGGDDPVADALASLRALAERARWSTPSELLLALIAERRVLELALVLGQPRDRWRRLRFLVDQARAWEDTGRSGLRNYLAWASRQAERAGRVTEVVLPETDDDAVRIMTIHAAKGLQFPITVVSGLTSTHVGVPTAADLLWRDGTPVARIGKVRMLDHRDLVDTEAELAAAERLRLLYVACTRARDHLVVSLHRLNDLDPATKTPSLAQQLAAAAQQAPAQVAFAAPPPRAPSPPPPALRFTAEHPPPIDLETWEADQATLLGAAVRSRTVAATTLAKTAAPAEAGDPGLAKDARDLELPPWQKGRYGTAIGRAVHAVLQTVDLGTGAGLAAAAAAQSAAEGVLGREDVVEMLAASALRAPIVREAATLPHWRELYVAAPVGSTLLEGYVDLLVRTPHGLVVVDYKTDAVAGDEVALRVERYRTQLAAYAVAVGAVTGEHVHRAVLVFCTTTEPIEHDVPDLPGAMAEVRARLAVS